MNNLGDRLVLERKRLNLKQTELAQLLNVTPVTARSYEHGSSPIPSDKLEELGKHGFDIAFIITGEIAAGGKTKTDNSIEYKHIESSIAAGRQFLKEAKGLYHETYEYIPLYDVEVSAGHGSFACEENVRTHLAFTRYSLQKRGLEPKMLACVNGKGDSMMPSIAPDDTLMIDMRNKTADGGIFVFRLGESYFVKRLVLEADAIRVISDNQIYPPWLINPGDDFDIIGKKVWQASWE